MGRYPLTGADLRRRDADKLIASARGRRGDAEALIEDARARRVATVELTVSDDSEDRDDVPDVRQQDGDDVQDGGAAAEGSEGPGGPDGEPDYATAVDHDEGETSGEADAGTDRPHF